ncbi:MAG: hypothetical protein LBI60_01390, partial [Bacteroidales bacterium]|nr:hypothetical protein [Bacteroidales bacterium]
MEVFFYSPIFLNAHPAKPCFFTGKKDISANGCSSLPCIFTREGNIFVRNFSENNLHFMIINGGMYERKLWRVRLVYFPWVIFFLPLTASWSLHVSFFYPLTEKKSLQFLFAEKATFCYAAYISFYYTFAARVNKYKQRGISLYKQKYGLTSCDKRNSLQTTTSQKIESSKKSDLLEHSKWFFSRYGVSCSFPNGIFREVELTIFPTAHSTKPCFFTGKKDISTDGYPSFPCVFTGKGNTFVSSFSDNSLSFFNTYGGVYGRKLRLVTHVSYPFNIISLSLMSLRYLHASFFYLLSGKKSLQFLFAGKAAFCFAADISFYNTFAARVNKYK